MHALALSTHPPSAASRSAAPTATPERTQWADVAKGLCIVLVVLWHVIMKHYLQLDWKIRVPIPGAWGTFGEQLLPLRMPLFFTISGMFAVGAVSRPWRVLARTKVAKFTYLYVLWLLIHTTLLALAPGLPTDRARRPLDLLAQLTITPSNLWYLYALALYFTIAKLSRRMPPAVVLGAAFALSAAASANLLETPGNRGGVYQNLVFFLAGMYARPLVQRLATDGTWRRPAVAGTAFAAALAGLAATTAATVPGVWPAVSVVATIFGITGAAYICRWPGLATRL
ncbi:MAG TPA: acyltransferase family protein, partial [Pilimelia sp.]|nr:acyltransferase family protein [Pilimelia sp.]